MSVLSAASADKDFAIVGEALDKAIYQEGWYKGKEAGYELVIKQKNSEIFWRNVLIGALLYILYDKSEEQTDLIHGLLGID